MSYTGGLRMRLIKENFSNMMRDSLESLDWFDSPISKNPVSLISDQIDTSVEIKPNIIGISSEDLDYSEAEMGSNLTENRWNFYIDILAESEAVGLHLSGDIFDILRGKISAAGRTRPSLEVKDLLSPDLDVIFTCQLDGIVLNRVRDWERAYNKYWWVVSCDVIDTYYDDTI